jgi:spermidine synthase
MTLGIAVFFSAWRENKKAFVCIAGLLVCGLITSCIAGGEGWKYVLSSGVFRNRETSVDPNEMANRKKFIKILFYEDAADATVSVEQEANGNIGLRISGKPEASTHADLSTQLLLAHLPMMLRPESKDVFTFGLASGITASGFLAYPIEHLTIAENCVPVLRAAKLFTPWNKGVLTNPVTRIRLEDARTVLKLDRRNYDVIVSEPSNPWFASVGSVFTREFYELAASRLKPGGFMVQWFHVYEMHDGIVDMVLGTFQSVFPVVEIWDVNDGDIILLGSDRPWECSVEKLARAYKQDTIRRDLASIGLGTPEALLAHQFASQRTAFAIAGSGLLQSDEFPVLEYQAPLAFYIGATASKIARFDERTWQSTLASPEKRSALKNISNESLQAAFTNSTINAELRQVFAWRSKPDHSNTPRPASGLSTFPSLFDTVEPSAFEDHLPPNATQDLKDLLKARSALQYGRGNWLEQVQIIRGILIKQLSQAGIAPERYAAHFAAVAARRCIVERQWNLAGELLVLGFRILPNEPELAFLARLLDREQGEAKGKNRPA